MKFITKLLLRKLKNYFLRLWFWRKHKRFNRINKELEGAVISQSKKRALLKYDIVQYVRNYLKLDKDNISKFIPYDYKTKCEVRYNVDILFGEEMRELNVKLNDKLQIV